MDRLPRHTAIEPRRAGAFRRTGVSVRPRIAWAADIAKEAFLETLWPTRCAVCDAPGHLICPDCLLRLPYIDQLRACPICGSAYGAVLCCTCSSFRLGNKELEHPTFDACRCAVDLDARTGRIATIYKDQGEQRLAESMAAIMAEITPLAWQNTPGAAVTFIPDRKDALNRRGFDHGELLARAYADTLGLPLVPLFQRPQADDQRNLGRHGRFANMDGRFRLLPDLPELPEHIILVDDVFTTGATLLAASATLKAGGVQTVRCVTFARA